MDIFELLNKQFERNLYVLEQLGEISGEEYIKLTIETLNKIPYSSELPSQQAKQVGVGEQHVDDRVSASVTDNAAECESTDKC